MLESFRYVNHLGEEIEIGKDGIFANENDLRDYQWNTQMLNNKIINLTRGYFTRNIPLIILCKSEQEGIAFKNKIFEVFEKDVEAKEAGKLYIGEYYMKCFVTESKKQKYIMNKRYMELEITVFTDTPTWNKERKIDFIHSDGISSAGGFDYPFGYPFDYGISNSDESILENDHFSECNFIITISGYAYEPSITIGNNHYKVNDVIVEEGELLVIDSKQRSITLFKINGVPENKFANRDRDNYIFQPIAPGRQKVYWNGEYSWELTLIEERSEPKWT